MPPSDVENTVHTPNTQVFTFAIAASQASKRMFCTHESQPIFDLFIPAQKNRIRKYTNKING